MDISEIIVAVVAILAGMLGLAKVIARGTKSKKDDEVVDKIADVADPLLDALGGKKDSSKE